MLIIGALDITETSDDSFQLAETGCLYNRRKCRDRTRHGEGFCFVRRRRCYRRENQTKAKSALSELHSLGAQAEFVELDVLTETSCRRAIERTVERFGRLVPALLARRISPGKTGT